MRKDFTEMVDRIGIDAGGSLTKIAYQEHGRFHVKTYENDELKELIKWLQIISPNANLLLTGGKSGYLQSMVNQKSMIVNEFEAIIEGTRYLLDEEKVHIDEYILVSIGTGTSVFHVTKDSYERMLGSGIGGGTLMGLGSLITGRQAFHQILALGKKGKRENSDLLVKDIYAPEKPPIDGNLTAANFAKAHVNKHARVEDHVAALIQLIGEAIISLASVAAANKQVGKIVFVGSTLSDNSALKDVLQGFQQLMQYEPVFLERGAYAGAIGTLL